MGINRAILFLFLFISFALCGENKSQRNFRLDLESAGVDSVTSSGYVSEYSGQQESPVMNGLYSLVLPGAGQFRSERYTKAVIFLGAEVALIAYAVISNNNGNRITKEFQSYAEAHWSAERYALWISNHGADYQDPNNPQSPGNVALDMNKVRNHDFSEINAWETAPHSEGFSHHLPKYQEQQYYELIGKYWQFKFGWDDYPRDVNGIPLSDNKDYFNNFTAEKQIKNYAAERGKANDYFYATSFAVSVLVINHVFSAIDGYFSTKNYNKEVSASLNVKPVEGPEGRRLLSEMRVSVGF